jgi:hypothetical protein
MKVYVSLYLPATEIDILSGKREANVLAKSVDWKVWEVRGRKGDELNKRVELIKGILRDGSDIPQWDWVSYHYPKKISRKRSEDHNKKIAQRMTGRSLSETHKQNISIAMSGNSNRT